MYCAAASMQCAVQCIKQSNEQHILISQAIIELEASMQLCNQYKQTWDSIHWNSSPTWLKKSKQQKLYVLSYDAYTHFLLATDYLNAFTDTKNNCQTPKWWFNLMFHLNLADSDFEYSKLAISEKQLSLFT